jgi:hypothetical protein
MKRGWAILILLLSFGSGCAQNSALEVSIDLPPGPTDGTSTFVLIQPRSAAENPFMDEWRGDDLDAVELLPGERLVDEVSVLSTDDTINLHLKVRFCSSPSCTAIEDDMAPERWFKLTHPFYIGQTTSWDTMIPVVPADRDTTETCIVKCQIQGCVDGVLSSYCRVDGRHLCE